MDKDTNRFKNSFFHYNKAEQCEKKNGIEIEEQIIYPRKLSQKENIRRNQTINNRSAENDQSKKGISQHNHYKRFQKSKEVNAQPVESVNLHVTEKNICNDLNLKIICHNINGLKENNNKLVALADWALEEEID
ncbi:14390_t:CDS:2, partial [Gigaspora margarita]